MTTTADLLTPFTPGHDWFVGVDSDGTTFDTMEIKHKHCFIPALIELWDLQSVAQEVRETAEFVNLYSRWRGIDRWRGLVLTFDLLRARGITVADTPYLSAFCADDSVPKSESGLSAYQAAHPAAELRVALEWSRRANLLFAAKSRGVPPFPYVRESLASLSTHADVIVVSSMPLDDLEREWNEQDLVKYVSRLGAQELGSKKTQLERATAGRYAQGHMLMIGDAPGDLHAARANGVLFYPINPGAEPAAWRQFYQEAMPAFLTGEYSGRHEERLVERFMSLLPDVPPWQGAEQARPV